MNIIDFIIILVIISCMIAGFKRGFTRAFVSAVGFIVVIVLAYLFKNPVSVFLYNHLPFFKFGGIIKGVTAVNIILYEIFAFLIVVTILGFILHLIEKGTSIFENFLKLTIVFVPLSKIGGIIMGLIEGIIWSFIVLFIVSLPIFNIKELNDSKFRNVILKNTPLLSNMTEKSMDVISDFEKLKEKYEKEADTKAFNRETINLFLKYEVVSYDSVKSLIDSGKLKVDDKNKVLKEDAK